MRAKTHIEYPMFSNRLLCGRKRTREVYYTWTWIKTVTCKQCKKKFITQKEQSVLEEYRRSYENLQTSKRVG